MTLEAMETLNRKIEEEFERMASFSRGCFGSLAYEPSNEMCRACEALEPCGHKANELRLGKLEEANEELEKESVEVELQRFEEFKADPVVEPEPEPKPEKKAKARSKATGNRNDSTSGSVRAQIDWNAIVAEMLSVKPVTYKAAAGIVKDKLDKIYAASGYAYTQKMLLKLKDKGILEWEPKTQPIRWL